MKLSKSQKAKVEKAINHHQKFRNAYYWTPPSNASGRRAMEKRDSFSVTFTNAGTRYEYTSEVTCSCRNVYYRGRFEVDGERKNVRAFKALI